MLKLYWHIHHDCLFEFATEQIENRIHHIKHYKPEDEIETRLRLLKPTSERAEIYVRNLINGIALESAIGYSEFNVIVRRFLKTIEELHMDECPDCPWNGRTIFSSKATE